MECSGTQRDRISAKLDTTLSKARARKLVTLNPETLRRLDDFRFGQRIASESEALRRLITIGLTEVEEGRQAARDR